MGVHSCILYQEVIVLSVAQCLPYSVTSGSIITASGSIAAQALLNTVVYMGTFILKHLTCEICRS